MPKLDKLDTLSQYLVDCSKKEMKTKCRWSKWKSRIP